MPTVTQVIRRFLAAKLPSLPGADIVERFLAYGPEHMETQVNASRGLGEAVEGKRNTWTDGESQWFHIRIPKGSNTTPEWNDYELRWAPEEHADAIGSTGWDWHDLRSRWVGFDYDDITGHAKGVGVSDEELNRVKEAANQLPYVEVRRSTGGKGIHLYILFDDEGVPTANHDEHAAVARCVLGMMTAEVGFDFSSAIDACGSNMWLWHSKITPDNHGLELLKPATRTLSVNDLPINWRDHIAVVTRQATKVRLQGLQDGPTDPFEELTSARRIIPLDDRHKQMIAALMETGFSTIWVSDHHLLQCHTKALEMVANDAMLRSKLGFVGHFQTSSQGKDPGQPNCFLFPLSMGGWRVYRFSQGISEAETWVIDGSGWTTCYFNRLPDVDTACRAYGGQRTEGKPNYTFATGEAAIRAAEALGQRLDIPADLRDRTTELRVNNNYLTVYVKKDKTKDTPDTIKGWVEKRGFWVKDLDKRITPDDKSDIGEADYDGILRALRSPAGDIAGWTYRSTQGDWNTTSPSTIKLILQGKGQAKPDAEIIMGKCALNPWRIICQPFQQEFPGGRQWNMDAPQLLFAPSLLREDEIASHPHWDKILQHVGTELTPSLLKSDWAIKNGVSTGAQYLTLWIAAAIREPFRRLPYLFLHGNENCGKSIFYESIALLINKGVVSANKLLTTPGDFNGELSGAVFCYVEEIDLSHHKLALPRIKEYVTADVVPIRRMRMDVYQQANTSHWIQVANALSYCPLFSGDSRITAIQVPDLKPGQDIPKDQMKEELRKEAPHFLYTLLNTALPPAVGRLRIPVVETESKLDAIDTNRTDLEQFVTLCCHDSPGERTSVALFCDTFRDWLDVRDRGAWTNVRISKEAKWKGTTVKTARYFEDMKIVVVSRNQEDTDRRAR